MVDDSRKRSIDAKRDMEEYLQSNQVERNEESEETFKLYDDLLKASQNKFN